MIELENMSIWLQLLVVFLVVNALFWGLGSHHIHCDLAAWFGIRQCPPHWVHLTLGVLCFLVAVYLQHLPYFRTLA